MASDKSVFTAQAVDAMARRLGLVAISSQNLTLSGGPLFHFASLLVIMGHVGSHEPRWSDVRLPVDGAAEVMVALMTAAWWGFWERVVTPNS